MAFQSRANQSLILNKSCPDIFNTDGKFPRQFPHCYRSRCTISSTSFTEMSHTIKGWNKVRAWQEEGHWSNPKIDRTDKLDLEVRPRQSTFMFRQEKLKQRHQAMLSQDIKIINTKYIILSIELESSVAPRMKWWNQNLLIALKLFKQKCEMFSSVKEVKVETQVDYLILYAGNEGLKIYNTWSLPVYKPKIKLLSSKNLNRKLNQKLTFPFTNIHSRW